MNSRVEPSTPAAAHRRSATSQADICIVGGGGRVGLPLALVLADRGMRVRLLDTNAAQLAKIQQGEVPFQEQDAQPLLEKAIDRDLLTFTSDPEGIRGAATIIVTIGTPVDEFLNPETAVIKKWADEACPHLADEQTVILRSTVFPGTTEWLDKYLKSKGKTVRLAYCPERIVQGFAVRELQELPQLISGTTKEAEQAAADLFEQIAPQVVRLSPMEAELAKLFANAYRYIHFAIANQFYVISSSAGIDYNRVLAGLKAGYSRGESIPRAGFTAGPCLLKDTMQLAAFSRNQFALGHAAMLVNEGLVLHLADEIEKKHDLQHMTVGLLGMAFKADCDDPRSSLSYKMKKILKLRAREVLTTDPYVMTDADLTPLESVVAASDLLILCTPHDVYRNLDTGGTPLVDIWGLIDHTETPSP